MKILNIISAYSPIGGTIGKLRKIVTSSSHEHIIYFCCFKENIDNALKEDSYYKEHNIETYYGDYGRNMLLHIKHISKIITQKSIDIVHFYFNYEHMFAPFLKILHPHIVFVRSFVGYIQLSFWKRLAMFPSVKVVKNYIFISEYIRHQYIKMYPGLIHKKSQIIYNAPVNVRECDLDLCNRNIILYVGGLNKHKNVNLLIEMMNVIVNQYNRTDIVLTIIGDGNERSAIENKILNYHLNDNVLLLGYKRNISDYLTRCKIYVHPATNEGFGISVVEAMYMYCPCIVADASALPELVDSTSGYILSPTNINLWAQKLIYLNDCASEREKLSIGANKRANKIFSMHSFISKHDSFYESLFT